MVKVFYFIFYLIVLFSHIGCGFYDYEKAESRKIIGNFYVVNLHLKEHPGFLLVFLEKSGYERTFLGINEQIDSLKANDSIILVKTKPNPETSFYLVKHDNGDTVLDFKKLFDDDFRDYESSVKFRKTFFAKD